MKKCGFSIMALTMLLCLVTSCGDGMVEYDTYGSISGTVIDLDTHQPIQSATVSIIPGSTNTYTSYNGTFEFIGLEGGEQYTVQAQKEGYTADWHEATVIPGSNVNVDLFIKRNQ